MMPRKFDKSEWHWRRHGNQLFRCPACDDGWLELDINLDWRCSNCDSAWADTGEGPDFEGEFDDDLFMMQQDADMERIKRKNEEYFQSDPDAPGRTTFPSNWTRRSGSNDVQVIPTDSENMFGEHSAEDGSGGVTSWPIFIYGDQSGVRIFIGRMDGYHAEMVPFLKSQGIDMDKYTMPPNPMPVRYTPETGGWREGQGSGHELRVPAEYTEKINEFLGLEPDETIKFG